MSSFKPLRPEDIDETLVKLIEFSNQRYVLLPFVDATGTAPEFRSLGHPTHHPAVRVQDLDALSTAMRGREQGAAWFILFSTPWLLRQSDGDAIRKTAGPRR